MKKLNIGLLLAICAVFANTNIAKADTVDYTGGLAELKSALNGTASVRNFFQTGLITADDNFPAINLPGTSLTINGNNSDLDGNSNSGFSITSGQMLKINKAGFSTGDGSVNSSLHDFYSVAGGVINNSGEVTITNSIFLNNGASTLGGAIYNESGTLNIQANGGITSFTGNTDINGSNAIYMESGTLNLNAGNGGQIVFNDKIASDSLANIININKTGSAFAGNPPIGSVTNGQISFNESVSNSTINLYNGTISLGKDNYLVGNNMNIMGGTLNLVNGDTGGTFFKNLSLTGNLGLNIDADLENGVADRITSLNAVSGTGTLNINKIHLLSDSSAPKTEIQVADWNTKDYVRLSNNKVESLLYKYDMSYSASSGSLNVVNTGFSPSIIGTPVAAMSGVYLSQTSTYSEALGRMDAIMFMPNKDRLLMKYRNKTASADGQFVFSPTLLPEERSGVWVKQYSTFENIPLNNGPNVSSVGYGMLIGADSKIRDIGHRYTGYMTAYVGYNGSHQNYDNVGVYQNGGLLGVTGTAYKGKFFAALTASAGASVGNNYTQYGVDNFTTMMAGAALKTGYNFEFLEGKMIIQPSLMAAYTFLNTFDYQAASGANITSDPLNAFQLSPGLKIIGNLKNGWQPYLGVNMVWSIMDSSKFYANDVQLPQLSVAPYVEYGVGLQRRWGDRFTAFGQAMARGGGRNGVALQFGLRWAI